MEKALKNYRNNLLIMFVCFVVAIVFNTHLFTLGSVIYFIYGIILLILGSLSLYFLILVDKDIIKSAKIAIVIGPIMSLLEFVEGWFLYGEGFVVNFRIVGLFIMIGGILIYNTGKKVIKNSF